MTSNSTPTFNHAVNTAVASDRAIPEPMDRHTRRLKASNIRRKDRREFRRELREEAAKRAGR